MCRHTLLEIFGLMVRRTIGFSDYWSFGPIVHWNIGMSPAWTSEIDEIKTVKIKIQNGPGLVGTNKMSPESQDQ